MKKIYTKLLAAILLVLGALDSQAQIAITKSGTAVTVPALSATYTSLANALTALNNITSYTTNGTIVFTCAAGGETNASAAGLVIGSATLNPLLSATNTVTIIKAGGTVTLTAGPGGTATPASAVQDGILSLVGADFITIDGLTFTDNNFSNPETMEYGIGLFKRSVSDGANNNSIKNCTITLNRDNDASGTAPAIDGSRAINMVNSLISAQATPLTPTSASGANSNNKMYSNNIRNCNIGIAIIGYYPGGFITFSALVDQNNDIGGVAAGTGNTILNYGGGSSGSNPAAGIQAYAQYSLNISYNNINSNNGSGANHQYVLRGIFTNSADYTSETINNNTITIKGGGSTASITAIDNRAGHGSNNNTVSISNNTITGCTYTSASSGGFTAINNTAEARNVDIINNQITGNSTNATSGTNYMITNNVLQVYNLNVNNNNINGWTFNASNSGTFYGIYLSAIVTGLSQSISNNNFQAITNTVAGSNVYAFITHMTGNNSNNCTINTNSFTNLSVNTTGNVFFINKGTSGIFAVNSENCSNNAIVTAFNKAGSGGTVYFYYCAGTSPNGASMTHNLNNFSNVTVAGSTNVAGWVNNNGASSSSGPTKTITNNTFNNITAITSPTGTLTAMTINNSGPNSTVSNNTITNFTGGSSITGIDYGSGNGQGTHTIASNTISGLTSTTGNMNGISVASSSVINLNVNNNDINTFSTGGAGINALALQAGALCNVFKNRIYDLQSSNTSASVNGMSISSGTLFNVHNNLIGDLQTPNSTGLNSINGVSILNAITTNLYYNTIYLNATSTSATTFGTSCVYFFSTATTFNSRNNIFYNASTPAQNGLNVATNGVSAAIRRNTGTTGVVPSNYAITSNNNAYWVEPTAGTNNHLTYVEGTSTITNPQNTVTNMKTFMGNRDRESIQENVLWQAVTGGNVNFLKYNIGTLSQLESGAVNIAGFTDDLIGTIRQGNAGYAGTGTAPDRGAWELQGISNDLTGPAISYTPFTYTACLNDRTLSPVTITDPTTVNIIFGTKPRMYFKKSTNSNTFNNNTNATDGWKYVQSTGAGGSPFSFTTDYSLLFGTPVNGDIIQYFIVAQDNKATPNVSSDLGFFAATPTSVALTAAAFPITGTINNYLIPVALSGTVNVGAAETFKSLTELSSATGIFANINAYGLAGNTTIVLMDAGITETGDVALNAINTSGCVAGPYTLTIKPATGVSTILTGNIASCLINLNGADHVTIDGSNNGTDSRDLTILNTSTSLNSAIVCFTSAGVGLGASNNTIKNCNLTGTTLTATSATFAAVFSGGVAINTASNGIDNDNNTIQNNNITKTQYGIYSGGESAANKNTGTIITGNVMNAASPNNLNTGGIYVRFDDGVQITKNDIAVLRHDGTVGQLNTAFGIAVGIIPNNTVTNFVGNEVTNAIITGNKIDGITQLNTTGYSAFGIVVNSVTSGTTLVANNMISGVNGSSKANNFAAGIVAGGGTGSTTNIYYNSVAMTGSRNLADYPSYALAIGSGDPVVNVKNNIFLNTQSTASTAKMYAIGIGAATFANMASDYNDFYVSGASTFVGQTAGLGTAGTDRTTLGNLQTATAKETNSISILSNFVSATDLHLAPLLNCELDGYGTPIAGVTNDYDNDSRDVAAPDMGADEFNAVYVAMPAGIAGSAVCANKTVSPLGTTYATSTCLMIASILPSGGSAVNGKINVCVTLDATLQYFNGEPYVQRHHDIEPVVTPATATASITLYYTDAEFVSYNTLNPVWPALPTQALGNTDPNRANVRVTQFHGTPTGGLPTTTPGNYAGTRVLITPVALTDVFWTGSYWAVTIPVTGFSGFYLHTTLYNTALPIMVNYLNGRKQAGKHLLDWKVTCVSTPRAMMTLERSSDDRNFTGIYSIIADAARCDQPFDHTDANPLKGMNYYRLKIVDADGQVTYSTTVALLNAVKGFDIISIAPNPVIADNFKLNVATTQANKMEIVIYDMQGRLVNRQIISLIAGFNSLPIYVADLAPGTYALRGIIAADKSRVIRFVKQ